MEEKDAVIVGARCAGSTLAERGWDVAMVDRDTFPSDTISTHMMFPNTLSFLDQLGVLDRLRSGHRLSPVAWRTVGLGHETAGTFTPIEGFDRGLSVRRVTLDKAIVDTAVAAGAEGRFGQRVVDLVGSGTEEDPVAGVVLDNGDEIRAKWIFGADGRASTVAGKLGIEKERGQQGEIAFMWGYWSGIPDDGMATTDIQDDAILIRWAVEDGLTMLTAAGPDKFTHGSKEDRLRNYFEVLRRFPDSISPDHLEAGEMISDLVVAPESLMRGYFRASRPDPGGRCLAMRCTSSIPAPPRGLATRSRRRSTSRSSSRIRIRASRTTSPGTTDAPPSTTTGRSRGAASRGRRSRRSSFALGRSNRTPVRTCATRSPARSRPRRH